MNHDFFPPSNYDTETAEQELPGVILTSVCNPEKLHNSPQEREPRKSASEVFAAIRSKEMERIGETLIRPRAEVICDHDHIEGQRIDVINCADRGIVEFRFKLRSPEVVDKIIDKLKYKNEQLSDPTVEAIRQEERGFTYTSTDNTRPPHEVCNAYTFERSRAKVFIADHAAKSPISFTPYSIQSAIGLVKIEIPADTNPETAEQILGEVFEKDFGIIDALSEVSEAAERQYKENRYRWLHKIEELTSEQRSQAERLELQEVFPGYSTYVDVSGHNSEVSIRRGVRAIHNTCIEDVRPEPIKKLLTWGLMSTTERLSRGFIAHGMSSVRDIKTGGADGAFTRIYTHDKICNASKRSIIIVFKPEIFDRTDWYCFPKDLYGTTEDGFFRSRISPEQILNMALERHADYLLTNEQVFRTGIGPNLLNL